MTARNGKIARLPREIRLELNHRLECSEPGPRLLAWLNGLPEARRIVQDEFDGMPISKQNLSQWRRGGFQEWLARQQLWAEARILASSAGGLDRRALVKPVQPIKAAGVEQENAGNSLQENKIYETQGTAAGSSQTGQVKVNQADMKRKLGVGLGWGSL